MSVARSMNTDTLTPEEEATLAGELSVWKTPQVKSCFEPIVLAQKPREGTFYNNWRKHHVGLVNIETHVVSDSDTIGVVKVTANVKTTEELTEQLDKAFLVGKPGKAEKGETSHLSVKPLALMRHLSEVLVPAGGVVLDPFSGSGSTGIGALNAGRRYVGFEKNKDYFSQSMGRFNAEHECFMREDNQYVIREK